MYPNSIEDNYNNRIEVFPNPANEVINVTSITEESLFEIIDIRGKKIKSIILSEEERTISVKDLANGVFILKSGNIREKFIINR